MHERIHTIHTYIHTCMSAYIQYIHTYALTLKWGILFQFLWAMFGSTFLNICLLQSHFQKTKGEGNLKRKQKKIILINKN